MISIVLLLSTICIVCMMYNVVEMLKKKNFYIYEWYHVAYLHSLRILLRLNRSKVGQGKMPRLYKMHILKLLHI